MPAPTPIKPSFISPP